MSQFLEGDFSDSFTLAFRKLYPRMVHFASRKINNHSDAADIVSDAFLSHIERGTDFNDVDKFGGILYVTVFHDCIDYLRRQNKSKKIREQMTAQLVADVQIDIRRQSRGEDLDMIVAEILAMIKEELTKLPPTARATLTDFFFNEKSARDIAKDRSINVNSVYDTKNNALMRLRKTLVRNS